MNTSEDMWARIDGAQMKVQRMQTKLHRWAGGDSGLRFDDLFNLVHDPDFLLVAWQRVAGNKGAHTPGIDEVTKATIQFWVGVDEFLGGIRSLVKSGEFRPVPVRRVEIPKANGKLRQLGIPTLADRVVQASLKLVLEPIFEADFHPCSYGFRPFRRAQDAIAEIQHMTSRGYVTVLEADIKACFDQIDHTALMGQMRQRVGDKKVLALVRAFLKAGIMTRDGQPIGSKSGTPQGGILSPLLANIALHVLDEHAVKAWARDIDTWHHRQRLIRNGGAPWKLIRYADDFVCVINGSQAHALALKDQVATILAPLGLELSEEKTRVVTIEEGFDFLGFNIRRMRKRGTRDKFFVYTIPSKKSIKTVRSTIGQTCHRSALHWEFEDLLKRINRILTGWANYFRHGVSKKVFSGIDFYTWGRIWKWLQRKHGRMNGHQIRRRFCDRGWRYASNGVHFTGAATVTVERYRYRGARIPTPWTLTPDNAPMPIG
ncbi:group II intron reverse transcriptase/maturase [Arthrobacter sp. MI7-26]|uniref:group II intron reverse transcriptase/maturase n=1 Tax=Arthrobacter sp. MI7-26 TaxID=2993653 RepID=UPI002248D22F|nr:group II intron reverse transcriptase/maturase [Arthrobacter sp. MI7-26]MCX2746874.1 group II intron reverse transcriptase/maturase [Arthrobacter sp. MI7-26]